MKSTAARDLDGGDLRERNRVLNPSPANLEMVAAIEHLIRQPVNLRLPEEKGQGGTKDRDGNRARQRISPQASIERRGRGNEQDQRNCAEPYSALEQRGVSKGNGLHLNGPAGELKNLLPLGIGTLGVMQIGTEGHQ